MTRCGCSPVGGPAAKKTQLGQNGVGRYAGRSEPSVRGGRHHTGLGEGLAAGFNRAVIDPRLHARVGYYVIPDGAHGLEIFIHRRLVLELGD